MDGPYRGWYRICVALWIIYGLASCASFIAALQDIYSSLVHRAEEKAATVAEVTAAHVAGAMAAVKDKASKATETATVTATATATAAAGTDNGQADVPLQSNDTELDNLPIKTIN